MELAEKIETALVAYLQSQTWPDYFDTNLILPGESDAEKTEQCIVCSADDADEEMPINSGNFWHPGAVELRTPSGVQTSGEESSGELSQIEKHKEVAAVIENALLDDELLASLTAAADDFTCIGILDRKPLRNQGDEIYSSGMKFRLLACSSDIS